MTYEPSELGQTDLVFGVWAENFDSRGIEALFCYYIGLGLGWGLELGLGLGLGNTNCAYTNSLTYLLTYFMELMHTTVSNIWRRRKRKNVYRGAASLALTQYSYASLSYCTVSHIWQAMSVVDYSRGVVPSIMMMRDPENRHEGTPI